VKNADLVGHDTFSASGLGAECDRRSRGGPILCPAASYHRHDARKNARAIFLGRFTLESDYTAPRNAFASIIVSSPRLTP
jgi:hypothetical protein